MERSCKQYKEYKMRSVIKFLDEQIVAYELEADSARWSNHDRMKYCKRYIKDLKKIKRELMKDLKSQKVLKL